MTEETKKSESDRARQNRQTALAAHKCARRCAGEIAVETGTKDATVTTLTGIFNDLSEIL